MIPPAKGETLGRSRRTGPFQGLIDDARQQSAMDVLPEDAHRQFYLRAPWKRIIVMFAGPVHEPDPRRRPVRDRADGHRGADRLHDHGQRGQRVRGAGLGGQPAVPARAPRRPRPPRPVSGPATRSSRSTASPSASTTGRGCRRPSGPRPARSPSPSSATAQRLDLRPTLITTELPSLTDENQTVQASFLGLSPVRFYERQDLAAVGGPDRRHRRAHRAGHRRAARRGCPACSARCSSARSATSTARSASSARPGSAARSWPSDAPPAAELSIFLQLLAAVNISLFLFNLLPIPPLDGGQIFPAIWESIKRRAAKLLGRPDPGPGGRGQADAGGLRGGAGVHRLERADPGRRRDQPGAAAASDARAARPRAGEPPGGRVRHRRGARRRQPPAAPPAVATRSAGTGSSPPPTATRCWPRARPGCARRWSTTT